MAAKKRQAKTKAKAETKPKTRAKAKKKPTVTAAMIRRKRKELEAEIDERLATVVDGEFMCEVFEQDILGLKGDYMRMALMAETMPLDAEGRAEVEENMRALGERMESSEKRNAALREKLATQRALLEGVREELAAICDKGLKEMTEVKGRAEV